MTNREMFEAAKAKADSEPLGQIQFLNIVGEASDNADLTCTELGVAPRDRWGDFSDEYVEYFLGSVGVMLAFGSQYATPEVKAFFDSIGLRY